MTTRAPSARNRSAVPRPIPEEPPVTMATFPESSLAMSNCLSLRGGTGPLPTAFDGEVQRRCSECLLHENLDRRVDLAYRGSRMSTSREHPVGSRPARSGCFDADQHAVELADQLPGYMERAFREKGWRLVENEAGRKVLAVGDEVSRLSFEEQPVPGS